MKKLLFLLTLTSFNSFANLATCDDVYIISNMASLSHYQKEPFNTTTISKSLYTFIDLYDPYKLFLSKSELTEFEKTFSDEKMISKLMGGDCSPYMNVHDKIQENKKKWFSLITDLNKNKTLATPTKTFKWNETQKDYFLSSEDDLKQYSLGYLNTIRSEKKKDDSIEDELGTYKEPSKSDLSYIPTNIIKSYVRALDPHSDYLDDGESKVYMDAIRGTLEGIGVEIKYGSSSKGLGFTVKKIVKGGPASNSGLLKINDIITSVDGQKITKDNFQEIMSNISGKKGSLIKLTIVRDNKISNISLTRDIVSLSDIKARGFVKTIDGQKILVLKMNTFYGNDLNENSTNDVIKIYKDTIATEKKIDGIIFDLRSNSGGLLEEAVKLTGLFVDQPFVVQTKAKAKESLLITRAGVSPVSIKEPLIVLINKGSASASEIFAGALKSYGRALIVGDSQTYGKGTVQSFNEKFDSIRLGKIKVTIAKFYFPNGVSPQLEGVHSDIEIPFITNYIAMNESSARFAYGADKVNPIIDSPIQDNLINPLKLKSQSRINQNDFFKNFQNDESAKKWFKDNNSLLDTDEDIIADKDMVLKETINICADWIVESNKSLTNKR